MGFSVEFRMDGKAIFPVAIDGKILSAPDTFNPVVGDRIYADHLKPWGKSPGPAEIGTMDLFVTGVEWRLRLVGVSGDGGEPQYDLVLRVTISSEAPSERQSRRAHVDRKK